MLQSCYKMNHFFYKLLFLSILLCTSIFVSAQPLPCEDPPTMTPLCADACIICDIDGFTGVNNGGASGEAPADFCTSTVHNGRWIAFIAGSEHLVVELSVSNCELQNPKGLELGFYEGNNCGNFNMITNCDGSIDENTSSIFTTNTPLTIGQYYYIVMDGNHGDVCEWTFNVLEGSTKVDPLDTSGIISGDLEVCINSLGEYSTTGQVGATEFLWTVDGETIQDGFDKSLELEWTNAGTYELCVTAFNACDEAPPSCETVLVKNISTVLLEEEICDDQSFVLNDTLAVNTAGTHEFVFLSSNACDSTVVLNLTVINCAIKGTMTQTPALCFGEASGQLDFILTEGTPPFSYTWTQLGTNTTGSGTVNNVNESVNISGLLAGTYSFAFSDAQGNDLVLIEEITQATQITAELTTLDFNGFNVSCFEESDGGLKVAASGGVSPYNYFWSTGENNTSSINTLSAGNYTLTITDNQGCKVVLGETLTEPNPLEVNALFTDPNCEGLETGVLEVIGVNGGTAPYLFDQTGSGFVSEQVFENLPEGTYTLTVEDANGCKTDTTAILMSSTIPMVDLGDDLQIVLGDAITLEVESNISLENLLWSSTGELSCTDCPNPSVQPFTTTTYSVQLVSEDGCVVGDEVTVNVENRRRVVIPNAFTPNQDGVNDDFTIFGGPEVSTIRSLQVFSRWGEKVFAQSDFQPNEGRLGWDGFYKFRPAQNGVYVWWAEVEFIDGEVLIYQGNVTLLR